MNSDKEWLKDLIYNLSAVLDHIDQLEAEKLELAYQTILLKKQNCEFYEHRDQIAPQETSIQENASQLRKELDYWKTLSSEYNRQKHEAFLEIMRLRNQIVILKPTPSEENP